MAREEKIFKAMCDAEWGTMDIKTLDAAFLKGARWADAHPNWISVDDALPEENEVVIAFDDRQGTLFTKRQTIIERNLYTKSNKITHWMRIPAPPKAE